MALPNALPERSSVLQANLSRTQARERNAKAEMEAAKTIYRAREAAVLEARNRVNDLKRRENTAQQSKVLDEAVLSLAMLKNAASVTASVVRDQAQKFDAAKMAARTAQIEVESYMAAPSGWKADEDRREQRRLYDEESQRRNNAVKERFEKMRKEREEKKREEKEREQRKQNVKPAAQQKDDKREPPDSRRPDERPKRRPLPPLPVQLNTTTDIYRDWHKECDKAFADYSTMTTFPAPPLPKLPCKKAGCLAGKQSRALGICACDMERVFRALKPSLKDERNRWHPDRFRRCPEKYRADFDRKAIEVFQVVDGLYVEEKKKARK